jgi:hypothetical protein
MIVKRNCLEERSHSEEKLFGLVWLYAGFEYSTLLGVERSGFGTYKDTTVFHPPSIVGCSWRK